MSVVLDRARAEADRAERVAERTEGRANAAEDRCCALGDGLTGEESELLESAETWEAAGADAEQAAATLIAEAQEALALAQGYQRLSAECRQRAANRWAQVGA
jgi:hypothetical protein